MLSRLIIDNVAVIEHAEIDFERGLSVLTGETGAGKSILVDSIGAVLGERTSKDIIRSGESRAFVCAEFCDVSAHACEKASELGFDAEDGTIILQREIREDGKSLCRINSRPATVGVLRDIGRELLNIHGQHENTTLLSVSRHLPYLDALAENSAEREDYAEAYTKMRKLRSELAALDTDEAAKEKQITLLRYQINELESASITPGELKELTEKRDAYRNFEKISIALNTSHELLRGNEESTGALEQLSESSDRLTSAAELLPQAQQLAAKLRELSYEAEDVADSLRSVISELEYDSDDLDEIENRLSVLERLFRKYGGEERSLKYLAKAKAALEGYEHSDELKKELLRRLSDAERKARHCAQLLTESRAGCASEFSKKVCAELAFLDMPGVSFVVDIKQRELDSTGQDEVEFLISTNAGELPRPLAKIASGGELSRIMLAIKNVLADKDDIDTLVFDEVDTGISGKAAHKVGVKLRQISAGRQIICVTHLAQIAAQAHCQMLIKKTVSGERTATTVTALSRDERLRELARIIGGENITQAMLISADEMLREAEDK